jgi:pSer/pThr/pTyr-binding forkhead associated (FHA) protein
MGQVIWIEILSRRREVTARHRFVAAEVRIGRGYDNDLVIDDPYLAARHLRIYRGEDGALVAEDLGSANGMFVGNQRTQRTLVGGDHPIRIGHTQLRIRDQSYSVAGERPAETPVSHWPTAVALAAAILGIEAASLWLAETAEPKASRYLLPLLSIGLAVLAWAAVWTVLSRIFSERARFERNLTIALAGLLSYSVYREFAQFAAFALSWRFPAGYEYAATWLILGGVAFYHLREINPSRLALKGGIVAAMLVIAVVTQTLTQSETRADLGQQSYLHRLLPPRLRLAPLQSEDAFFADVEKLRAKLDHDRVEAQPGGEPDAPGVGR